MCPPGWVRLALCPMSTAKPTIRIAAFDVLLAPHTVPWLSFGRHGVLDLRQKDWVAGVVRAQNLMNLSQLRDTQRQLGCSKEEPTPPGRSTESPQTPAQRRGSRT